MRRKPKSDTATRRLLRPALAAAALLVATSAAGYTSFPAPARLPGGLAWDGARLLVADRTLYEIDPADGQLLGSVQLLRLDGQTVFSVRDVAYDPATDRLFGCRESELMEFERTGYAPVQELSLPFRCGAMLWEGSNLLIVDSDTNTAVRMSRSGDILETLKTPFRPGSIAFDARLDRYYATRNDTIRVLGHDLREMLVYDGPQQPDRLGGAIEVVGDDLYVAWAIEPDITEPGMIAVIPGVCGDRVLTPGEECDSGTPAFAECCTSHCRYAPGGSVTYIDELPFAEGIVLSGDGETLAGTLPLGVVDEAFTWREDEGVTLLDLVPPESTTLVDVSSDGSVRAVTLGDSGIEAAIWDDLGLLPIAIPPGDAGVTARGVSGDGATVVGVSWPSWPPDPNEAINGRAVRWEGEFGSVSLLPGLDADARFTLATHVSEDGSVILGGQDDSVFLWSATEVLWLDDLPPMVEAYPDALSADGSTAIVRLTDYDPAYPFPSQETFLWRGQELETLPVIPPAEESGYELGRLSTDGSRVLGATVINGHSAPVLWVDGGLPVDLRSCAENDRHWRLVFWSMSDDGRKFAGLAYDPASGPQPDQVPFILTLPEPDPTCIGVAALTALGLLRRRRLRRPTA